jgi:transcriptional regulator with XRE-family HTH domain
MFGERLRALRKQRRETQEETAAGVTALFPDKPLSQKSLSLLEQRDTFPRGIIVEHLAAYFKVPVAYFVVPAPDNSGIERAKVYLQSLGKRRYYVTGGDEEYAD